MGWKTSFQPQRPGSIHREEPAQFPILVSCCPTHRWLRTLRRQKAWALESPSSAQLAPSSQLKSTPGWLGGRASSKNQVQINAGRKESFLPLSSPSSPDAQQPQLGRARGRGRLRFSLIALHYTRPGEAAVGWAAVAGGRGRSRPPAFLSKLAPVTWRDGRCCVALGHCTGGRSLGTCISRFQLSALFLLHEIKDVTLPSESRQGFLSSVFKKKKNSKFF